MRVVSRGEDRFHLGGAAGPWSLKGFADHGAEPRARRLLFPSPLSLPTTPVQSKESVCSQTLLWRANYVRVE